jgi:hypothetical protein
MLPPQNMNLHGLRLLPQFLHGLSLPPPTFRLLFQALHGLQFSRGDLLLVFLLVAEVSPLFH